MGARGCLRCVKAVSVACNSLIALIGTAVIFTVVFLSFDYRGKEYMQTLIDRYHSDAINSDTVSTTLFWLWGVGLFTVLVGLIGVLGACLESFQILFAFSFLLGLNMVAQIVCGMATYAYMDEIKATLHRGLVSQIDAFVSSDPDARQDQIQKVLKLLEETQDQLKCCGCNNISDYSYQAVTLDGNATTLQLPKGCTEYQDMGCCDIIWHQVLCLMFSIGYGCLGLLAFEILALLFAMVLARTVSSKKLKLRTGKEKGSGDKRKRRVPMMSKKEPIFGHQSSQSLYGYSGRLPQYLGPEESTHL